MLRPHLMSSIIVAGPNNYQQDIINELYRLKILHIVEHHKNELADIGKPTESAGKLSDILVKVRAIISSLDINSDSFKAGKINGLDIESVTVKIANKLNELNEQQRKIDEEIAKNNNILQELNLINFSKLDLESFTGYKTLAYFSGFVKNKESFEKIKEELSKTTNKFSLLENELGNRLFVLLFIESNYGQNAAGILQRNNFSAISLVNIGNLTGKIQPNIGKLKARNEELQSRKESINNEMNSLKEKHSGFLVSAKDFLEAELEKAEAPLRFASTKSSFIARGWVPTEDLGKLIDNVKKASKNKAYIHFEPAKTHSQVPVKLKNPKMARPFEFFLDLYSMPKYSEIDPTFFIFLTFPLFFGLMLGDIGYGLVGIPLFWLLKKKMPSAGRMMNILMISSLASILAGFVYGEFFGKEIYHPLISREHEMFKLMFFAIGIGILHVNIGLIVGFVNAYRAHGLKMAIYEKGSWILLQAGIALLALSYFDKITISPIIGAAFLGMALIFLWKGEGVKGLIELPSILTNILSYARLMAIGLSSVILAVIVNEQSAELFHKGGLFILFGVLLLVIGHVINLMLGLLGSFLHSLRLHYVEFFSKFYHGGAEKYQPFGTKE